MKITVTESMFHDMFRLYNRLDNFSYEARSYLYDYFVSAESDEFEFELDVIALCCDYVESTYDEIRNDYRNKFDAKTSNEELLEALDNETTVIWYNDTHILYLSF